MVRAIGDQLLSMVSDARDEVLLIAPFIKVATLDRLMRVLPQRPLLRVVTRWRLDEVAAGASDLEVWPLINERPHAELWLQPVLHAKYYRVDHRVLLGSANLTGGALGWGANPNLEILIDATAARDQLEGFEDGVWRAATQVNHYLYLDYLQALQSVPKAPPRAEVMVRSPDFATWRPALRFPEDLFCYYCGDREHLTGAALEAAAADHAALDPPMGLSGPTFITWIGAQLRLHPEVQAIDAFGRESRRFGEMSGLLKDRGAEESARAWQTWMRWLGYFLPENYRFHVANYSEIFQARERH
jgi:hypothetical protein